ncbi:MAG: plasmid mobilization relaxosome protein MobC [Flammeovirgaceae bacterium]
MKTLRAFLEEQGLDQSSPTEKINEAKKTHRKQYIRAYHDQYKKEVKRTSVTLSKEEHKQIESAAKRHQIKVATFIKACTLAYLEGQYILPEDTKVQALELGIRKIGNNINQIVRKLHGHKYVNADDIEGMQHKLHELEALISNSLRRPERISTLLEQHIKQNPEMLTQLELFVQKQKAIHS